MNAMIVIVVAVLVMPLCALASAAFAERVVLRYHKIKK